MSPTSGRRLVPRSAIAVLALLAPLWFAIGCSPSDPPSNVEGAGAKTRRGEADGSASSFDAENRAPPAPAFDAAAVERQIAIERSVDALLILAESSTAANRADLANQALERAREFQPEHPEIVRRLELRAFDPDTELAGFTDLRAKPQIRMARRYLDLTGEVLSRRQREQVQDDWREDKRTIDARVAAARNDPFVDTVDVTRHQVANQPFFRDLEYEVIEDAPPFALFVQTGHEREAENQARLRRVRENYLPFLRAFQELLDADLAPMVGDGAPPEVPAYVVWFLDGESAYSQYFQVLFGQSLPMGLRAHYDPKTRWSTTHATHVNSGPQLIADVQPLLHELVHAYVDRVCPRGIRSVSSHWLNEGLAEYYACFRRSDAENIHFRPRWSERTHSSLMQDWSGFGDLRLPFEQLVEIPSGALEYRAAQLVQQKTGGVSAEWVAAVSSRFYADAYLLVLWLMEGEDSAHQEAFRNYIRAELQGEGGADVLKEHLGEIFERDMDGTVSLFAQRLLIERLHGPAAAAEFEAQPPTTAGSDSAAPAPPADPAHASATSLRQLVDPAALEGELQRAWVFAEFVDGGYRLGDEASPSTPDAAALALVRATQRAVDSLLTEFAANESPWRLPDGSRAEITGTDGVRVQLRRASGGLDLHRRDLDPAALALELRRAKRDRADDHAAICLLSFLTGDSRVVRSTAQKLDGEIANAVQSLTADESMVASIQALTALQRALRTEDPRTSVAALYECWSSPDRPEALEPLRSALSDVARSRAARAYTGAAALQSNIHGNIESCVETPEGGLAVTLHYSFDDEEELQDFPAEPAEAALQDTIAQLLPDFAQEPGLWRLNDGKLQSTAACFGVHRLTFQGELSIELVAGMTEAQYLGVVLPSFWTGLSAGQELVLSIDGNFLARLAGATLQQESGEQFNILVGEPMKISVDIGENTIELERDGKAITRTVGLSTRGRVFLLGSGQPGWFVDTMRLSGTLAPDTVQALARERAARETAACFGE